MTFVPWQQMGRILDSHSESTVWPHIQALLDGERERDTRERELLCASAMARQEFLREYIPRAFSIELWADGMYTVVYKHPGFWTRLMLAWKLLTRTRWELLG